jgi:predicted nucleic acid-binding protein
MAVLDTTLLMDAEHGDAAAHEALRALRDANEPLRVTAASWMEYLASLADPARSEAIGRLLSAVQFEPMTRELAESGAALQYDLYRRGERLSWHDVHMAATAVHYNEPLVTRDQAFARVRGLRIQPY